MECGKTFRNWDLVPCQAAPPFFLNCNFHTVGGLLIKNTSAALTWRTHLRGWNLVKTAASAAASSPDHMTTATATTTLLVAAGLIGFWYTLMCALIKLPAAVTPTTRPTAASFPSSHSERVPLPVDSSREIKLPDLFSPVPGMVSGGFRGVRWAFNWAQPEEMCRACCTNRQQNSLLSGLSQRSGGGAEATPQRWRVSPR